MKLNNNQLKRIHILSKEIGLDRDTRVRIMKFFYGAGTSKDLTVEKAEKFIRRLEGIRDGEMSVAYRSNGDPYFEYTGNL